MVDALDAVGGRVVKIPSDPAEGWAAILLLFEDIVFSFGIFALYALQEPGGQVGRATYITEERQMQDMDDFKISSL